VQQLFPVGRIRWSGSPSRGLGSQSPSLAIADYIPGAESRVQNSKGNQGRREGKAGIFLRLFLVTESERIDMRVGLRLEWFCCLESRNLRGQVGGETSVNCIYSWVSFRKEDEAEKNTVGRRGVTERGQISGGTRLFGAIRLDGGRAHSECNFQPCSPEPLDSISSRTLHLGKRSFQLCFERCRPLFSLSDVLLPRKYLTWNHHILNNFSIGSLQTSFWSIHPCTQAQNSGNSARPFHDSAWTV
jgi:hypothetical protein